MEAKLCSYWCSFHPNIWVLLGQWHPTPVLLPGESHGLRSLVGCSLWGCEGSDMTEWLHFHFSLSCIGEGNGSPLQCSCLENPGDGGAWWAAIYGVAQSRTRMKRLSSSSSRTTLHAVLKVMTRFFNWTPASPPSNPTCPHLLLLSYLDPIIWYIELIFPEWGSGKFFKVIISILSRVLEPIVQHTL